MKEALSAVLRRPRVVVEQFVAYLLLGYLAYLWLALPVKQVELPASRGRITRPSKK